MPTILIGTGRERGARFEFDDAVTLGRAAENKVRLVDSQISRFHARVEPCEDGWQVVDLGSRNGVRVDEEMVKTAPLLPGDSFSIGSITVHFEPPEDVVVDPSGTGNLVRLSDNELDAKSLRRHSIAPPVEDASETLDVTDLLDARERLEAVLDIYAMLGRERDPEQLAVNLTRRVRESIDADRTVLLSPAGTVSTGDEGAGDFEPMGTACRGGASETIVVARRALQEAQESKEGILTRVKLEDAPAHGSLEPEIVSRTIIAAPLLAGGRAIAVLYVDRREGESPFNEADLSLVSLFAAQAGEAFDKVISHKVTQAANRALRRQVRDSLVIVGQSESILEVVRQTRLVAQGGSTVLIRGETGTGKELVARLVHEASGRHQGPFVAVNCAAIVEGLLESELFGHERGAFTGAERTKKGQFELADGGTLFLDEIGDMDLQTQKKLLRVLEERRVTRVGGTRLIPVDVRIVAATNLNLERAVKDGGFREDLFYRLSVIPLKLPPLRERREDIPLLVDHYVERFAHEMGRQVRGLNQNATDVLMRYPWPGNIRELRNVIERAVVFAQGETLTVQELPPEMTGEVYDKDTLAGVLEGELRLVDAVSRVEREVIARAMERTSGNKSETCKLLGISRPTLDRKLKEHEIDPRDPR